MRKRQGVSGLELIPRITVHGTAISGEEWEAEGRVLQIVWFGFVFEAGLSRIVERYRHG